MNSRNRKDVDSLTLAIDQLSLILHLQESFPELSGDRAFITTRCDRASETYENAVRAGHPPFEAVSLANEILFQDLHFSKHDTLVTILWNEFADSIPQRSAKKIAIKLLPECERVFAKYFLSDDFAYSPEFELLYTELTGTISIYLEEHGLQ
jgi:Domain of unknown function (DUF1896).